MKKRNDNVHMISASVLTGLLPVSCGIEAPVDLSDIPCESVKPGTVICGTDLDRGSAEVYQCTDSM